MKNTHTFKIALFTIATAVAGHAAADSLAERRSDSVPVGQWSISTAEVGASTHAKASANDGQQVHQAYGRLLSSEPDEGRVTIAHDSIETLNWPAMKMEFAVTDKRLLNRVYPSQMVSFSLIKNENGQLVVDELAPL